MVDSSFLLEHGVRLWFEGSRLRFKIPDNGLTRGFYSAVEGLLRENKPALRKNYTQWLTTGSGGDDRCDELYGRFNPQTLGFEWWSPETGCIGSVFAFDTETSKIDLETHQPPDFVLGSAATVDRVFLITRRHLRAFWDLHKKARRVFMHNARFDIRVVEKHCGFDFIDLVDREVVVDTYLLYRLCRIAEDGDCRRSRADLESVCRLYGIKLTKEDETRCGFGGFLSADGECNYAAMPGSFLRYAAADALATYDIGCALIERASALAERHGTRGLLSLGIQVKAGYALSIVEQNGLAVDREAVERLGKEIEGKIEVSKKELEKFGYAPGVGSKKKYQVIMEGVEKKLGVRLERTEKTGAVTSKEQDLKKIKDDPFVAAYLEHGLNKKVLTHLGSLRGRDFIHPEYVPLLNTGRTATRKPNIQGVPHAGGVRECFRPREGNVFIVADYTAIELCTLAQHCITRYGGSKMGDLINAGGNIHCRTAAEVLGIAEKDVGAGERQKAKVLNFGLPGGMGIDSLIDSAREGFGVDFSRGEAEELKNAWFELYPEIWRFLNESSAPKELAKLPCIAEDSFHANPEVSACVLIRIAGGHSETTAGRGFSADELDWAWEKIDELLDPASEKLAVAIEERRGSKDLQREVSARFSVVLPSGRVRSPCAYTEAHNGVFQGMAADGAKLALYALVKAGYRVAAFIHDEMVIEVPHEKADEAEKQVCATMVREMEKICPDVKIRVKSCRSERWSK